MNHDTTPLLIRCPACGQRFKVGVELRERTVECGACERRFRITEDVILRSQKFYPGERATALVNRYQRVPIKAAAPEGLQTASYSDHPDLSSFEPVVPQRLIAGAAGVLGFLLMAMFLYFGALRGGALDGVAVMHRMVMAGFVAIIATWLLVYANPRARGKALLFSLLCGAGLLALPLVVSDGPAQPNKDAGAEESNRRGGPTKEQKDQERIAKLRQEIGTDPLTAEMTKLAAEGGLRHAYGLWLRGLSDSNKLLVRDYLLRVAAADPSSHAYPRGRDDYLMVVSGVDMEIDELAKIVAPLGEVVQTYNDINVIEVRVNNGNFVSGPLDKLTNKDAAAFYELNKRELDSIDLERVQGAVRRLAEAEPKMYRNDITRRLVALLRDDGVPFKDILCVALMRWSDEPASAADAAEAVLKRLVAEKKSVPRELITLLVESKRVSIIPILDELWFADPGTWEPYYVKLGAAIEPTLIGRLPDASGGIRYSIVHMLGKVGGRDSLPALEAARAGAVPELLLRIETAEKSIRERLGE